MSLLTLLHYLRGVVNGVGLTLVILGHVAAAWICIAAWVALLALSVAAGDQNGEASR